MTSAAEWNVDATSARLNVGSMTAVVDFLEPRRGLHDLTFADERLTSCEVLGIELEPGSASLTESYQRGGDLIANYAETPSAAMTTQIYWRAAMLELHGILCPTIDLQVSVQTSLLDARPALRTRSRLPTRVVERFGTLPPGQPRVNELFPHLVVFHTAGWKANYIEMVHPSAAEASVISEPNAATTELAHRLFECELEKGVILRAQVRGLFMPCEGEIEIQSIASAFLEFMNRPPSLTA